MSVDEILACLGLGWLSAGAVLAFAPHASTFSLTLVSVGGSLLGVAVGRPR